MNEDRMTADFGWRRAPVPLGPRPRTKNHATGTKFKALPILAVVVITFSACAGSGKGPLSPSAAASSSSGEPVKVVLGLYSGVPDPTWTLTTQQANDLGSLLAGLKRINGVAPMGGLGYHGFSITASDGALVAFDGKVAVVGSDPPYYLDDPGRTIERLLLQTARTHVTTAVYAAVARELDQT